MGKNLCSFTTLTLLISLSFVQVFSKNPEAGMNFTENCKYHNFPVEEHLVETADGYILRVYRIQAKGQSNFENKNAVVFFQHGLYGSSDDGIVNDEERAPLFMLAQRGYDVWVGNTRGNTYSQLHKTLSPKKAPFWHFSIQQMAQYDVPANLGYVAKCMDLFLQLTQVTGKKVHYIGHSQGTTQMFAALSLNVEGVRENMLSFIALAPVTFVSELSTSITYLANHNVAEMLKLFGVNEFLGKGWYNSPWATTLCFIEKELCNKFISGSMDLDPTLDNVDRVDVIAGHIPAGTSTQNMIHWETLLTTNLFYQYDFQNAKENQAAYGQDTAPLYPLEKIDKTLLIEIFIGSVDKLADPTDAYKLVDTLKSNGQNVNSQEYNMGHLTFMNGLDMQFMNRVFEIIEQN